MTTTTTVYETINKFASRNHGRKCRGWVVRVVFTANHRDGAYGVEFVFEHFGVCLPGWKQSPRQRLVFRVAVTGFSQPKDVYHVLTFELKALWRWVANQSPRATLSDFSRSPNLFGD